MRKFAFLCAALMFFSGCAATTQDNTPTQITSSQALPDQVKEEAVSSDAVNEKKEVTVKVEDKVDVEQDLVQEESTTGVVFGKVDFSGILNKSYITLSIRSVNNPDYKFKLHVGDKEQETDPTRDVQVDENGYFFMSLPEGQYQVTTLSIPVSSTMAVEMIDIIFDVTLDEAAYLGHLSIEGTKEKIHWGGIPVVKPGFEYVANLKKDEWEAYNFYKRIFPDSVLEPVTRMMEIRPVKVVPQSL